MPKVPEISKGGGIQTGVSQSRINIDALSPMANALSSLGKQGADVANAFLAQKKKRQTIDFQQENHIKYLREQESLMDDVRTQSKNGVMPDGRSPLEHFQEQDDLLRDTISSSAPTPEARNAFIDKYRTSAAKGRLDIESFELKQRREGFHTSVYESFQQTSDFIRAKPVSSSQLDAFIDQYEETIEQGVSDNITLGVDASAKQKKELVEGLLTAQMDGFQNRGNAAGMFGILNDTGKDGLAKRLTPATHRKYLDQAFALQKSRGKVNQSMHRRRINLFKKNTQSNLMSEGDVQKAYPAAMSSASQLEDGLEKQQAYWDIQAGMLTHSAGRRILGAGLLGDKASIVEGFKKDLGSVREKMMGAMPEDLRDSFGQLVTGKEAEQELLNRLGDYKKEIVQTANTDYAVALHNVFPSVKTKWDEVFQSGDPTQFNLDALREYRAMVDTASTTYGKPMGNIQLVPKEFMKRFVNNLSGSASEVRGMETNVKMLNQAVNAWEEDKWAFINQAIQVGLPSHMTVIAMNPSVTSQGTLMEVNSARGMKRIGETHARTSGAVTNTLLESELNSNDDWKKFQTAFSHFGDVKRKRFISAFKDQVMKFAKYSADEENSDSSDLIESAIQKVVGDSFAVVEASNGSVMIPKNGSGVPAISPDKAEEFMEKFSKAESIERVVAQGELPIPAEWRAHYLAAMDALRSAASSPARFQLAQVAQDVPQTPGEFRKFEQNVERLIQKRWAKEVASRGKWVGDNHSMYLKMPSPEAGNQEGDIKYFELKNGKGKPFGLPMSGIDTYIKAERAKDKPATQRMLDAANINVPFTGAGF